MKTVVITGASRGIGAAIAERFKTDGWFVIGTSTKGCPESHASVDRWCELNLVSEESTVAFCRSLGSLISLDAFINNAGINIIKRQSEVTLDDYSCIHKVNLSGPYFAARAAAMRMAELGGGRIVNIASIWSVITREQRTLYTTMKTALSGLTRAMAVEWAPENILVNTVSPGFVATELTRQSLAGEQYEQMKSYIPLGRFAEPAEIANVVAFLCGEGNTYLTGQNIVVDGAFSIQ